jgi:hypothetical protein
VQSNQKARLAALSIDYALCHEPPPVELRRSRIGPARRSAVRLVIVDAHQAEGVRRTDSGQALAPTSSKMKHRQAREARAPASSSAIQPMSVDRICTCTCATSRPFERLVFYVQASVLSHSCTLGGELIAWFGLRIGHATRHLRREHNALSVIDSSR